MRIARLLGVTTLAALSALAFTSPAAADNPALPIHDDHVPMKAADFGGGDVCEGPFKDLADDVDGWHFVLPGGGTFVSLTLKFHTDGGDVTAVITGTEGAPSSGTGWEGYLDNAGDADKHAYVFTDAGWELFEGTASVTDEGRQGFFNLSHTCAGTPDDGNEPTPSPTPTPTPTSPVDDPTPTPTGSTPGGNLPKTGFPVSGFVIVGAVLLVSGAALLALRRRREIADV